MKTLNFYILRRVFSSFCLGLFIFLLILSLERVLRLIQIVAEQAAAGYKVFEFLFYLMPHYLGLAIPAALFFAVLIVIRRMQEDSELVVIQAAGVSPRQLYWPILLLLLPVTLIMSILASYGQPHARYAYRQALHHLVADSPLDGLQAGEFYELDENTTLRAEKIDMREGYLEGVFVALRKPSKKEQIVIAARSGQVTRDSTTKELVLIFENGNLVRDNQQSGEIDNLSFQSYPWILPNLLGEAYGPRGRDEREMDVGELLKGSVSGVQSESSEAEVKTEFHSRLVQVLSLPLLLLWTIPLALIGSGRTGKAGGIILGAGLLVLYEKLVGLAEAYAASGDLPPWLALWSPWLVLGLGGLVLVRYVMPRKLRIREAAI
jgi:lipopolysaccharide export system permease protein